MHVRIPTYRLGPHIPNVVSWGFVVRASSSVKSETVCFYNYSSLTTQADVSRLPLPVYGHFVPMMCASTWILHKYGTSEVITFESTLILFYPT